jgi:hypothetical protein
MARHFQLKNPTVATAFPVFLSMFPTFVLFVAFSAVSE